MQIRLFGGLDRKSKLHKIPETYAQLAANFTYTGRRFRPIYGMLQLEQVPDNTDQLFLVETIQATNSNTFTQVASTVSESNVGHALTDVGFETWQVWYPNRYSSLMPALFESNVGHGMLDVSAEVWQTWFPVRTTVGDDVTIDMSFEFDANRRALTKRPLLIDDVDVDLTFSWGTRRRLVVNRITHVENVDVALSFGWDTVRRRPVVRTTVVEDVTITLDFVFDTARVPK